MQQPPAETGEPVETDHPEMSATDRAIENLAGRLRIAYFRKYDERVLATRGRSSNHTVKDLKKWRPIATALIQHQPCNPEAFIASRFAGDRLPLVRELLDGYALIEYRAFCEEAEAVYRTRWTNSLAVVADNVFMSQERLPHMSKEALERDALNNLGTPLAATFRCCFAAERGWHDIALRFRELAMEEMLADPNGYSRAWEGHIPAEFLEELDGRINEVR